MSETDNDKKFITYYGEYSLYQWIEMILKKEIVLPPYQRDFVWSPEKIIELMKSFNENLFVTPIIIANYKDKEEERQNFVIDGQQRLSALLLAFLGIFPIIKEESTLTQHSSNGEHNNDDDDEKIEWTFSKIQKFNELSISKLQDKIKEDNKYNYKKIIEIKSEKKYKKISSELIRDFSELKINEKFMKNHFLGFSYIKSIEQNEALERQAFAKIFRNINTSGVELKAKESRAALYWLLTKEQHKFFTPDFAKNIKIENDTIDFGRYLAILSNTNTLLESYDNYENIENRLLRGYSNKVEEFIETYVTVVMNGTDEEYETHNFTKLGNFEPKFKKLSDIINLHEKYKSFDNRSIADYYLFGLLYFVLFENKDLNFSAEKIDRLSEMLKPLISNHKEITQDGRYLEKLKNIRTRVIDSIRIYYDVFVK